ncbi:hypothetical protein J6590_066267 [Homalodisca vitripennis]|nr:hypothetical protein J6590_066267 [Homalodisca vitripennis]
MNRRSSYETSTEPWDRFGERLLITTDRVSAAQCFTTCEVTPGQAFTPPPLREMFLANRFLAHESRVITGANVLLSIFLCHVDDTCSPVTTTCGHCIRACEETKGQSRDTFRVVHLLREIAPFMLLTTRDDPTKEEEGMRYSCETSAVTSHSVRWLPNWFGESKRYREHEADPRTWNDHLGRLPAVTITANQLELTDPERSLSPSPSAPSLPLSPSPPLSLSLSHSLCLPLPLSISSLSPSLPLHSLYLPLYHPSLSLTLPSHSLSLTLSLSGSRHTTWVAQIYTLTLMDGDHISRFKTVDSREIDPSLMNRP